MQVLVVLPTEPRVAEPRKRSGSAWSDQLRRAVLLRPDLIGALYNLAVLAFDRGAMKDAESYLLRYMRLTSQPNFEALVMGVKIELGEPPPVV